MRIILTAFLGGLAMFVWSSIAHMVLPLGEVGMRELPNESATLDLLQNHIPEPGLYLFPGFGLPPDATREQQHEAMKHMDERVSRYPQGIMMFYPKNSRPMMMGRWLTVEFLTELAEAFIVVWLLSLARLNTFGARFVFATAAGVLAAIATNISYWNWYGFPGSYTAAYIFNQVVGFILVGLVAGLLLKSKPAAIA